MKHILGDRMKRASGVMLHISSLPNKYGFGCFSKEAYDFVDFLKRTGQHYWQVLPLNTPDDCGSPFSSFSVFAGNPCFIDLTEFLEENEIVSMGIKKEKKMDFKKIYSQRIMALKKIYERHFDQDAIDDFRKKNKFWIEDYATYMAIKDEFGGVAYTSFPEPLRNHKFSAVEGYKCAHKKEVEFYIFVQYLFMKQWDKLRKYANDNGVQIIGDIAFYPSSDSSDVWANREEFCFDKDGNQTGVAGVPPDYFSEDGQLWGNPVYNIPQMKRNKFNWWVKRFEQTYKFYDMVRIDHFRGFESFWVVPAGAKTAKSGKWVKGPGYALFKLLKGHKVPDFLVEDLGIITPQVKKLIQKTKFPAMRVFQFAFDGNPKNPYYPHNYINNCVAYLGTHDNNTFVGFLKENSLVLQQVKDYLKLPENSTYEQITDAAIFVLMNSVADLVVLSAQDLLYLDERYRMNTPGTIEGNWSFRLPDNCFTKDLEEKLLQYAISSKRV